MNIPPYLRTVVCCLALATPAHLRASDGKSSRTDGVSIGAIRLALADGFADESAYRQAIADEVARLVAQADKANTPGGQVRLRIQAANTILARGLEPACTCKLLGIEDSKLVLQPAAVESWLTQVDELLRVAREACARAPETWEDRARLRAEWRIGQLEGFAAGLRAFLLPAPANNTAWRSAASALSLLREEDDPRVVAAAGLWQAQLRSVEEDKEPAMASLPLALSDPDDATMPYAMFSRLLRCRLIAARGQHAVALSLLAQIEERCEDWFDKDAARQDARRAAILVRTRILAAWADALDTPARSKQRQWCLDRRRSLLETHFIPGACTVMRLAPAIPMLDASDARGEAAD